MKTEKLYDNEIPFYNEKYSSEPVEYSTDFNGNKTIGIPDIIPFPVEGSKCAVVIYPGGGYYGRSDTMEGTEIAEEFNKYGITAFVVRYRTGSTKTYDDCYHIDAIRSDGWRGIQYARYYADKYGYDKDKIVACGFSAGGHLALITSLYEHDVKTGNDEISEVSSMPNALMLCYACVTLTNEPYCSLVPILAGPGCPDQDEFALKYSAELHVTKDSVPAFIWYGDNDTSVPPARNGEAYYTASRIAGAYAERYHYPNVCHGVGLARGTSAEEWPNRAVDFLKNINFI